MNRVHVGLIALLGAVALAAPGLAQTGDNVACYTVRDRAKRGAFTLTVTNAGVTQSCRVTVPARLGCLATQVSNVVTIPARGADDRRVGRPARRQVQAVATVVRASDPRPRDERLVHHDDHYPARAVRLQQQRPQVRGHVRQRRPLLRGRLGRRLRVSDDGVRRRELAVVRRVLHAGRGVPLHGDRL